MSGCKVLSNRGVYRAVLLTDGDPDTVEIFGCNWSHPHQSPQSLLPRYQRAEPLSLSSLRDSTIWNLLLGMIYYYSTLDMFHL